MIEARLILVRHGHCESSGTYCGRSDAPLTEEGRAQAGAAAEQLATAPISICFSSPLSRAMETARIICSKHPTKIVSSPLIREIDFGEWEGLTYPQIASGWPDLAERWLASPTQVAIPGGEAFSSLRGRVKHFLQELPTQGAGDVLVVAHGGSIAALKMELRRGQDREFFKLVPALGSVQIISRHSDGISAEAAR